MNSRRGFIQRLAAGTLLAPLGATGLLEPTVKLVEPAKISPVAQMPDTADLDALTAIQDGPDGKMQIVFRSAGWIFRYDCETFIADSSLDLSHCSDFKSRYPKELFLSQPRVRWMMTGYLTQQWKAFTPELQR